MCIGAGQAWWMLPGRFSDLVDVSGGLSVDVSAGWWMSWWMLVDVSRAVLGGILSRFRPDAGMGLRDQPDGS